MKNKLLIFFFTFVLILGILFLINQRHHLNLTSGSDTQELKVMTYSSFIKSWGPGPDLAKEFEKKYHTRIKWIEVGNAGMIIENLKNRSPEELPDVVLGLDLLAVPEARAILKWKKFRAPQALYTKELPPSTVQPDFIPIDWSPLTFIFRRTELPTPLRLDDLLKENYSNTLALQDPRTSATGMYFLIWVLAVKGEEAGFEYLKSLRPSIRIISPTWSAAYSLFQNNQAPMVFSFFTSTIYHYINEDDPRYQPVYFDDPHVYSVEYAAIPEKANGSDKADDFLQFLLTPSIQKLIMEKNYMLPVIRNVKNKTPFDFPKAVQLIGPEHFEKFIEKKEALLKRWKDLSL